VGFAPGIHQSGDIDYSTGVNPRAKRQVRNLIIEARWIAIRHDPVMQNYFRSLKGKNSKAVAFKIGRKLLARMLGVIKTETTYSLRVVV
jgi:transposase